MIRGVILLVSLVMLSCAAIPHQNSRISDGHKIIVGSGPEDFVLDQSYDRLITACDERRAGNKTGEIWEVNLNDETSRKLKIIFKDSAQIFHPHGISKVDDYLFVISHQDKKTEAYFRFKIYKDSLVEDTIFSKGIIGHGNDIIAVSKDEFYYSDFKMFGGSIVHFKDGEFSKFSKHYKYPNGLIILNDKMYVSTTLSNRIYEVELASGRRQKLAKVKGADNIMTDGELLYTTSHPKFGKFIKHAKSNENLSPTVVYSIQPNDGSIKVLYSNDGSEIPAGSTAWVHIGKLYISQVFENYIWVAKIL